MSCQLKKRHYKLRNEGDLRPPKFRTTTGQRILKHPGVMRQIPGLTSLSSTLSVYRLVLYDIVLLVLGFL